ncbi:sugar ABC transporter ATP-binding protein [Brevibacterium sp. UCMA 11754]|uniref:sugar ABC transporter ATP-binding protein n=1 Tax=Brevibacterium sp. UCMA 11754 TaxID=2749198 RepID=UPI001F27B6E4|nr:sugar ABC transporter ATP-binding protein [Brevibacterium sp. UCMA 11754]MCF2571135.1 sugar ABC transporter ATP-binding protein [Brevibacterium sp. UCMA 11754]
MTGENPRLRATGLSKRYGAVRALTDVEFTIQPGEIVALLGENGAGKSTLVKVLSGLVTPDEGTIEIDGVPVDLSSSSKSQAAGIAVVQQEYSTVGALTIAENLALGSNEAPFFWTGRNLRARANELLAEVGLSHLDPRTLVEELSVAEMQLLEIARVLARDARIVIFDEPTAALSDTEAARVLDVVRRLASRGISIIYVTHRLPEVFAISEKVAIFRNGLSQPSVVTAKTNVDEVIALMLGRRLGSLFPEKAESFGSERIRLENVHVAGLRKPVSFVARQGEILGLTGQLGSGADLIIKAIGSETEILTGTISIDNEVLHARTRAAGIREGIAYVTSDRKRNGIFAGLSILMNLSASWLKRISSAGVLISRREREKSTEYASSFTIDVTRLGASVGQLSGGNQQKVVLARWLGNEPRVFLVEEPTRGVDVGARADIYRKLRELCDRGMTVIVTSSDTAEIYGLCDTIGTFYHGELAEMRPADDWTEDRLVASVMNRSE